MRMLLLTAVGLQIAAVIYCALLLRRHRRAAAPWLCLLGVLLSMLVWRMVMTTGVTPSPVFNTSIAIWGSVCALLGMFFFGREVARRQRAEVERDQLLDSERAARGEAERANRIKDDFLATLSHELRTPLAAVLGWSALARRRALPAETDRALETIERNARVQVRLVDDLIDATRMQAGTLHLERVPVSLGAAVRAALEGVRPLAEAKQLALRYTCSEPGPVVLGDAGRLQQVVANLLVNAVKFTPEGRAVSVALHTVGDAAELEVVDEGMGITPEFMPQLFRRFQQADSGTTRRHGGLGLGLSIVASLVDLHGGEVRALSDGPGKGARFIVRLPLAKGEALQAAQAMAAPGASRLDGIRVLIVDDEADVRGAVAGLLERAGAVVLALESGAAIADAIARFQPVVLVLDIGMPGEDGYSLMRRIRQLPAGQGGDTPAISLTAHARDTDRRLAIESGFQAHLAKPVNLEQLLAAVHDMAKPVEQRSVAYS